MKLSFLIWKEKKKHNLVAIWEKNEVKDSFQTFGEDVIIYKRRDKTIFTRISIH